MPISSALFRKSAVAAGTVALGLALVAGTGITSASAAAAGVTKLVIVTSSTNIYAGDTATFTVLGENADGDIIDNETAASTLSSYNQSDNNAPDTATLAADGKSFTVDFADTGTHIVSARQTGITTGQIAVSVTPGAPVEIRTSPATANVSLHSTTVFSTKSYDSHGNARGNATVVYKSSSSHDVIHGSSITFGSYGTRTITVTSKSFTTTAKISVLHKFTAALHFSGTFAVGHTISSSFTGIPSGVTATRVWKRDGVAISGATAKTYKITSADKGHSIKLSYVLTKTGYFSFSKSSSGHTIK